MGKDSGITWTTHTFNPWRGCQEVSPGCDNCYARTLSLRNPATLGKWGAAKAGGVRVLAAVAMWKQPLKWDLYARTTTRAIDGIPDRVFCASLADWAEDWQGPIANAKGMPFVISATGSMHATDGPTGCRPMAMNDAREMLFSVIDQTAELNWLLLTKRPKNIRGKIPGGERKLSGLAVDKPFRKNLWLGTTVENQKYAQARLPYLVPTADLAPVRFLSVEPMLGPVDLLDVAMNDGDHLSERGLTHMGSGGSIDWVICGAESGANRRPMNLAWARSLRDQCWAAGVSFFMKQLEIDGKVTDEVSRFPADLQVQEFPRP